MVVTHFAGFLDYSSIRTLDYLYPRPFVPRPFMPTVDHPYPGYSVYEKRPEVKKCDSFIMHSLCLSVPGGQCYSDAGASRCESISKLSNFPLASVHDIGSSY